MDGFHTQKQNLPKRQYCPQRLPLLLAGSAIAFSLCINSGCSTMQGAKKDLHLATCGEAGSPCACSCGECTAKLQAADKATVDGENASSTHAAGRHDLVIPPNGQTSPGLAGVQSKFMTIEGMPGVWTPEQSIAANSSDVDSPAAAVDRAADTSRNFQQSAHEPIPRAHAMQGNSSVPFGQANQYQGAYCPPDMTRSDAELKEYRAQVQILSQQISQIMQTQDSIKASQETLQQSHEREILELKLQQTTADRDRLEREREMDRELQKQRDRDLETIDSFAQIIENVVQIPAPPVAASRSNLSSVPRASTQSSQGQSQASPSQSKSSQLLPTVDESR